MKPRPPLLLLTLLLSLPALAVQPGKQETPPAKKDDAAIAAYMKDAGVAPFAVPDKPVTQADYYAAWRKWIRRILLEPMAANIAEEPWKDAALQFTGKALDACYSPRWVDDEITKLAPAARQLVKDGADDAVVLWLASEVLRNADGRLAESRRVQATARDAFRKSRYSKVLGATLYMTKAWCLPKTDWYQEDEAKMKSADFWLAALMEPDTIRPEDAPFLLEGLRGNLDSDVARKNPKVFNRFYHPQRSKLPPWALETLAAIADIEVAWTQRSGGSYGTPPPVPGDEYEPRIKSAEEHLRKAWELEPGQPFAANRMMIVTLGERGLKENARVWFDRSIQCRFDGPQAWDALEFANRTQWGGSVKALTALGLAAVQTERYDSFMPWRLMDALDAAQDDLADFDKCRALYQEPVVAAALTKMFDGYQRHAKNDAEREHFAWCQAFGGWLTGRHAEGAAALKRTGTRPLPALIKKRIARFQGDVIRLRGELALGSSGQWEAWTKYRDAMLDRKLSAALEILTTFPASLPPDALALIKRERELMEIEQRLEKGEWVKLTTDAELSHWQWGAGWWGAGPDGSVIMNGDDDQPLLTHRARIGPRFEARGTFTITNPDKWWYSTGFAFQHATSALSEGSWFSADILQHEPKKFMARVRYNFRDTRDTERQITLTDAKTISWSVEVKDRKITWKVDGRTVTEDTLLPDSPFSREPVPERPNGRVGFCFLRAGAENSVTMPPIEIRRLP